MICFFCRNIINQGRLREIPWMHKDGLAPWSQPLLNSPHYQLHATSAFHAGTTKSLSSAFFLILRFTLHRRLRLHREFVAINQSAHHPHSPLSFSRHCNAAASPPSPHRKWNKPQLWEFHSFLGFSHHYITVSLSRHHHHNHTTITRPPLRISRSFPSFRSFSK